MRRRRVWGTTAMVLLCMPGAALANDGLSVHFDTANPRVHELIEPLRLSCIRRGIARGEKREAAIAAAPGCLAKRFMAAIELERMIRVMYPESLTPEELLDCARSSDEDQSLLRCTQEKGL